MIAVTFKLAKRHSLQGCLGLTPFSFSLFPVLSPQQFFGCSLNKRFERIKTPFRIV